jgi:superfamily II DNA or RNA helicase
MGEQAMIALRDYQQQAVAYAHKAWDAGCTRVPMVLATGLGKGHPLETEVPTPHGWRRWGDLEVSDSVFGRDGSSTEVLEIHDRGVLETYRVTFSDESSVLVDGDHLWTVRDSSDGKRWKNLETRSLAQLELRRTRGWRFHVPMTAPLERKPLELPLDPYVVGALISNGSMTNGSTQLTTPDLEVAARVTRAFSCTKINDRTPGTCDRYYLPGLTAATRELGMRVGSLEKRVPAAYLEGSLEQRLDLLHGLMDGDGGGRDASRRSVAYFTSSEGLARDVSELVTSLGGTGIVKRYDRGAKGVEYAVRILLPSSVPAFSTARKNGAGSSSVRNLQPKRAIVSVKPEGSSTIRCIRVAARDSLYLITRQHIVTHNTEIFTSPEMVDPFLNAGQRVLIIAHTDELVQQAATKARRNNPGQRVGVVKGSEFNEVSARIIVSSRQTLQGVKRREQIRNVGLIVIDEAHHALRKNTYGAILEHFGAFDDPISQGCLYRDKLCDSGDPTACCHGGNQPRVKVLGVTATLARGDKSKLSTVWEEPPGGLFRRDILFGIRRGYLLDVRGERIVVPDLDMANVRKVAGDYQDSAIAEELERTYAPEIIAEKYLERARDRKGIAFWPLVETAEHGAKAFNAIGIRSEVIHGDIRTLPKKERRAMLRRLHTGETQVIHGVSVLTEGFDEPTVDVVVIARPTRSAPLYQQMVGRVLRPNLELPPEQREKALILDVVGAGATHDLRSLIDLAPERPLKEHEEQELSLLELEQEWLEFEEEERKGGATFEFEGEAYAGATETVAFDPLGREKLWSRTAGGTWFMSAGTVAYAFLAESIEGDPGTWDVALCSKWQRGMAPWAKATDHVMLPLDLALGWAEEVAIEVGGYGTKSLTGRKSKWRAADPTPAQLSMARSLRIDPTGMDKGELSQAIDTVKASQRIDPLIAAMKAMQNN